MTVKVDVIRLYVIMRDQFCIEGGRAKWKRLGRKIVPNSTEFCLQELILQENVEIFDFHMGGFS